MDKNNSTKNWKRIFAVNIILIITILFFIQNINANSFQIEWDSKTISPETWTQINLTNKYYNPIVVASPEYSSTTNANGIGVWITNVTSTSFLIRTSDENFAAADSIPIHYIVIEKGSWTIPGTSIKIEAGKLSTNKVGSQSTGWTCPTYGETITFSNTFDGNPLVLSTRGSNNNPSSWAVTFQHDPSDTAKTVTTTQMCLGLSQSKATSPGSITNNETIYWIATDEGNGILGDVEFEILWNLQDTGDSGGNWINGYGDSPPFSQSWSHSWTGTPDIIIGGATSVAGSDGGWPIIYDTGNKTSIRMFIDEANERAHSGSESGGGWAFDTKGNYGNIPPTNNNINFTKTQIFMKQNNTINGTITDINGNNTINEVITTITSPNSTKYNISLIPKIINENLTSQDVETGTKNYTAISNGEIIGEAGEIKLVNRTTKTIHFTQTYSKIPIIIGIVATQNNDDSPFIPVIHSINKTDAVISLCRDNGATTCDNNYLEETVNYAIFDITKANNYSWLEVGNISTLTDGSATSFNFNKTFSNAPSIWALPQTYNIGSSVTNGIAGHSWFTSITTTSANIIGCDHPGTANTCAGTATENFGYIAIDTTNENFKKFSSGSQTISNSAWTSINFGETYNKPRIFVMANSENGGQDPSYPWAKGLTSSGGNIRYCEADGANYCDSHNGEVTKWFVLENGVIGIGNGGDDIEKNSTIATYNNIFSETTHNITELKININITKYTKTGSTARSNNNPDLEIELSIEDKNWKNIGSLNITSTGLYSITITNNTILKAWENKNNRNLKINEINFDYYSTTQIDEIYWNLTTVEVKYKTYTSNWYNEFSNTEICGQYNLTDLFSTDNLNETNHTIHNNIYFNIPCGPIVTLISPINKTKLMTEDKVNFTWYLESSFTNLTCQLYINSILNQTINCTSFQNNSINIKLKRGYYNWTINATDKNNLSQIVTPENFWNILKINNKITKTITSINTDLYQIVIYIKNKINSIRNITTEDFVENKYNYGSFNIMYNWLNYTNNLNYNGTIFGWNYNLDNTTTKNINYSITKNSNDYKLLDEYIIRLD